MSAAWRWHARPYTLPLRRPLTTAAGTFVERSGFIVVATDGDGRCGRGDVACWPGFGSGTAAVAAALPVALAAAPLPCALPALAAAVATRGWPVEVAHGIEQAALDLTAQQRGLPLARLWAAQPAAEVAVHALVDSAHAAQRAVAAGHTALKLKLGSSDLETDVMRVAAVRAAVGARIALRLDANAAWSVMTACRAARLLAAFAPEWLEQPVAAGDIAGLAAVRACGAVPVAADESVHDGASLRAVLAAGAADVVVLKPMFVGGLQAAHALHATATAAGVRAVFTHAMESAVGRAGVLHLAAACGDRSPMGLASPLAADVAAGPDLVCGSLAVPVAPGLGIGPLVPAAAAC